MQKKSKNNCSTTTMGSKISTKATSEIKTNKHRQNHRAAKLIKKKGAAKITKIKKTKNSGCKKATNKQMQND